VDLSTNFVDINWC